jgi:hypothetical protein
MTNGDSRGKEGVKTVNRVEDVVRPSPPQPPKHDLPQGRKGAPKKGRSRLVRRAWVTARGARRWLKKRPAYSRLSVLWEEREYHLEDADKDLRDTRPPEGVEFELKSIRLMELFPIEDLERLQEGVLKLFPGIENDPDARHNLQSFLKDAPESFVWNHPWKLGHVAREKRFSHFPYREMRNLPEVVHYIDVDVIQFTRSFFILCLDVHLNAGATQKISGLQSTKYIAKVGRWPAIQWALRLSRYLEWQPPSTQRRQAVLEYLQGLRAEIERLFANYFRGYFMNNDAVGDSSKLPALESYVMRGAPQGEEEFGNFLDDNTEWWRSLGCDFFIDSYIHASTEPKLALEMYYLAQYSRSSTAVPHRMVTLEDALIRSSDSSRYPRGKDAFIKEQINRYGVAVTPAAVLWQFLLVMRKRVARLNRAALKLMRVHWWTWFRPKMRQHIRLNNALQQESMVLDRLNIEWEGKIKEQETNPFRAGDWEPLERMKSVLHERAKKPMNLNKLYIEEISERIRSLEQQLEHLRNWHGQHLLNKNAWVTFGLAIIVLLATLVGLVQILPLLKKAILPYIIR